MGIAHDKSQHDLSTTILSPIDLGDAILEDVYPERHHDRPSEMENILVADVVQFYY